MELSEKQSDLLSNLLADVAKILIASVVIGFFVPLGIGPITPEVFLVGSAMALLLTIISIYIAK
jgi:hypothetical protein